MLIDDWGNEQSNGKNSYAHTWRVRSAPLWADEAFYSSILPLHNSHNA
jgi:hypothetical protein